MLELLAELRRGVVLAREALEVEPAAVDVAIAALHDLEQEIGRAQARQVGFVRRRRFRCPCCAARFDWPGERDEHVQRVHDGESR